MRESGLYDFVDEIRCCVLGQYDPCVFENKGKVKLHASSGDMRVYETFTLNTLHEDCKTEDMNVLYVHTKGVTKTTNALRVNVKSWVQYMCFFLIYKYKDCVECLKSCDTVGLNLHTYPVLHYSGNFWWATSAHIKRLEPCHYTYYNSPEFWITERQLGKHRCLWESDVNHYHEIYPPERYAHAVINSSVE
jgi:hypothetical protein